MDWGKVIKISAVAVAVVVCIVVGIMTAEPLVVNKEEEATVPVASSTEESTDLSDAGMELVFGEEYGRFAYYRESVTDVMYVRYRGKSGYAGMGGLTVMLEPETGLPLTYQRYLEMVEGR